MPRPPIQLYWKIPRNWWPVSSHHLLVATGVKFSCDASWKQQVCCSTPIFKNRCRSRLIPLSVMVCNSAPICWCTFQVASRWWSMPKLRCQLFYKQVNCPTVERKRNNVTGRYQKLHMHEHFENVLKNREQTT